MFVIIYNNGAEDEGHASYMYVKKKLKINTSSGVHAVRRPSDELAAALPYQKAPNAHAICARRPADGGRFVE